MYNWDPNSITSELHIVIDPVLSVMFMYIVPNEYEDDDLRECYGVGKRGTVGIPFKILFRRSCGKYRIVQTYSLPN